MLSQLFHEADRSLIISFVVLRNHFVELSLVNVCKSATCKTIAIEIF